MVYVQFVPQFPLVAVQVPAHAFVVKVVVTNNVVIKNDFFINVTPLIKVTFVIPNSVTSISGRAFYEASHLGSIVIPESVTSIGSYAFYGIPRSAEIYCPNQTCKDMVTAAGYTGTNFFDYTKGTDGVYSVGDTMYASAEDMRARQNACTSEAQCREKVQEYKEAKATQMAQNGVLCQTKQGCLNLMNMVSNDAYECTTIATCSAAVKNGTITGVNLAAADPVSEPEVIPSGGTGTGGTSEQNTPKRRIYTVQEATDRVKELGTDTVNFRIRYK